MTTNQFSIDGSRCLLLGGNGFIGKYVCQELLSAGAEVSVLGRSSRASRKEIQSYNVDLCEPESLVPYFRNTDVVICLAPSSLPASSNANIDYEISSHVRSTVRIAELASEAGVKKFIFVSSGGTVYGESEGHMLTENAITSPICAYGVSKRAIESYLTIINQKTDMNVISLRISNPYGLDQDGSRGQGIIAALLYSLTYSRRLEIWGNGSNVRDYIHVTDAARSFCKAIEYSGNHSVFNISSGTGLSLNELINEFEKVFSIKIPLEYIDSRSCDVVHNVLDNSLAETELGWKPLISFSDGLISIRDSFDISLLAA